MNTETESNSSIAKHNYIVHPDDLKSIPCMTSSTTSFIPKKTSFLQTTDVVAGICRSSSLSLLLSLLFSLLPSLLLVSFRFDVGTKAAAVRVGPSAARKFTGIFFLCAARAVTSVSNRDRQFLVTTIASVGMIQ